MVMLSIVTPCYNEEATIEACHAAVRDVLAAHAPDVAYEHIFIDNCSTDSTVHRLRVLAAADPHVRVIVNARNFGPARSPYHALLQARGDAVIPVLADLQTPAEIIPEMIARWRAGAKAVLAVKRSGDQNWFQRWPRALYYRLLRGLSRTEQIPDFEGYGLYDRCVLDALRTLREPEPYFRGLVLEVGFERSIIMYDQPPRLHGKSSYNLYSLADFALLGLSVSSRAPLRLMTLLGFSRAVVSFIVGFAYLIIKLAFWYSLPIGVAPVLIAVFFLSALQLFALGVLGEYVGLLLNYSRNFPLVIEKERINFPASGGSVAGSSPLPGSDRNQGAA
jgi:polyisoprenyl-phosphate glycosyltransferase